jgi:hypothetical protein
MAETERRSCSTASPPRLPGGSTTSDWTSSSPGSALSRAQASPKRPSAPGSEVYARGVSAVPWIRSKIFDGLRSMSDTGHQWCGTLAFSGAQVGLPLSRDRCDKPFSQQFRAQRHVSVMASLTLPDVDDHAVAIDVFHFHPSVLCGCRKAEILKGSETREAGVSPDIFSYAKANCSHKGPEPHTQRCSACAGSLTKASEVAMAASSIIR